MGRYQEAIPLFQSAIQVNPCGILPYTNLWITYQTLGQYENSLQAARDAARLQPDSARAYDRLGISYGDLRRFPEAREAFLKAMGLEPWNVEIQKHWEATLWREKNPRSSDEDYQRGLLGGP